MTHTPGPWKVSVDRETIVDANGYYVSKVARIGNTKENQANARLIAAAPALLEAVEYLIDECEKGHESSFIDMELPYKALAQADGRR